jgi:hypothetical protein
MDTLPTDKLEAALEQLEAERERRTQAKIDAGEAVRIQVSVVTDYDSIEEAEAAEEFEKARALAAQGDVGDKAVIFDVCRVRLGVPSAPYSWRVEKVDDDHAAAHDSDADGSSTDADEVQQVFENEESLNNPTSVYVRVIIRHGDDDGDPGEIAEGYYSVEGGALVLTDCDGGHLTNKALLGEDPATLARRLLREAREPSNLTAR